ncbi:PrsW family glutamic-type intramembrane protease [Aciduricibacillus chroicocephali]|uniref:PrsW family glutamic-type intramembrane protease n=1 Tax=Aciduricibacillus chroicocephali TaxID=3054939 RepID=A0ABY9KTL0_9BACI|nr:PrsW family glutamic-type intramembrane protease [Bacillaceae bacterium 44XB]
MYCHQCGEHVNYDKDNYCQACGAKLEKEKVRAILHSEEISEELSPHRINEKASQNFSEAMRSSFAKKELDRYVGDRRKIKMNVEQVFSEVFEKHTKDEAEMLFAAGTRATTPKLRDIEATWPKPWLFARVFLIFALTYILLYIGINSFNNQNTLPGLIVVGSFAGPFALLIFFWEMNAPQNVSIYETAQLFFVGGAASLVAALILYSIFPVENMDVVGAVMVGVIEEIGKLAIVAYFIKRMNPIYILNGLLIGAAIGAGFAAFESAGYAFRYMYEEGLDSMLEIIFLRGWQSVGGHVVWSAIGGAALMYAKGSEKLAPHHFFSSKFLKFFIIPIVLHALWDMIGWPYAVLLLIAVAWFFIYVMIHLGLKQIVEMHDDEERRRRLSAMT